MLLRLAASVFIVIIAFGVLIIETLLFLTFFFNIFKNRPFVIREWVDLLAEVWG